MGEVLIGLGLLGCVIGVPLGCDNDGRGWVLVAASAFIISVGRAHLGL
jgi:hypothetical protein